MPLSSALAIPYPKTITVGRVKSSCFTSCFHPSSAGSRPAGKRLKPNRDLPLGVSALQPRLRNVTSRSGNAVVIITSIQPAYCSCSTRASPRKTTRSPSCNANDSAARIFVCTRSTHKRKSAETRLLNFQNQFISSYSKADTTKTEK